MKDKTRLLMMKVFGAILVLGIVAFISYVFVFEAGEGISPAAMFWLLVPAVLIILVLVLFLKRLSRGVKSGLPVEDEMSQRIKERAGYLATIATVWFLVGLMWYHMFIEEFGFPVIRPEHIIVIILAFMFAVFFGMWGILSRKGIR